MPRKKKNEQGAYLAIKTDIVKRRLFHKFTEDDVHILNEKIAELTEKKEKFSEEAKTVAAIVKGTDGEIKKALAAKAEGGEEREMECPVTINYTEGSYTVTHPETGVVIESRPLKAEERQQGLFDEEPKQQDAAEQEAALAEEMADGPEDLLDEQHAEEEYPEKYDPEEV